VLLVVSAAIYNKIEVTNGNVISGTVGESVSEQSKK